MKKSKKKTTKKKGMRKASLADRIAATQSTDETETALPAETTEENLPSDSPDVPVKKNGKAPFSSTLRPSQKRPGAKKGTGKGNVNALKNGKQLGKWKGANHNRLTVGNLPLKMKSIQEEARLYRRDLEAVVCNLKGEINVMDAHLIDTASAATVQAGIGRWLLRERLDEMSASDIRGCTADIVKAKERRDNAVKQLKIDAPLKDFWERDDETPQDD